MPTSEKFEPEIFLGTIHAVGSPPAWLFVRDLLHPDHVLHNCLISIRFAWTKLCQLQDTSLNELLSGRHNLNNEMSERTGQLKALVSELHRHKPDASVLCKKVIGTEISLAFSTLSGR